MLHTEVDEGAEDDLTLVYAWLCAEPGLLALPAPALPRPVAWGLLRPALPRQVNPLGGRALPDSPLAEDLYQVLEEVVGSDQWFDQHRWAR